MQLCTVTVNLGGNVAHQATNKPVTVAEIQILKHIHGQDSVHAVLPTGTVKRAQAQEVERLRAAYSNDVVGAVFPGSFPALPTTLRDIGMDPKSQAKIARAKAEEQMKLADQLDKADDGDGMVGSADAPAPMTADDIFGEDKQAA